MKTTVEIPDAVLAEVQALAAKEKTTLKSILHEALIDVVQKRKTRKCFKLKDCSFRGNGLQVEFQNASWDDMRDEIYGLPRR